MDNNKFIDGIEEIVSISSINHNILEGNEAQTRWLLIDHLILNCWGYTRQDIIVEYSVDSEDRVNTYTKLDYAIILNNKPKLLVEAKSLGIDLYSKFNQISYYFNNVHTNGNYAQKELMGILTDGDLYLFYTDSKEYGVLDSEPFYTIRLSCSEDIERLQLQHFSKEHLLKNDISIAESVEDYDLSEHYRVDMIEGVLNHFESQGIDLSIQNVYIKGRLRNIKSFRGLYREILKEVNTLQPYLLYELAQREESCLVEGAVSDCKLSLICRSNESIEIKTQQGIVYASMPRTRKGVIDRIVVLLKQSDIGLFNVSVRLKYDHMQVT